LIVEYHANCSLAHVGGILVRCFARDAPSYSGVGASGKPGAVQKFKSASPYSTATQLLAYLSRRSQVKSVLG
jgi:hypothetical protein